MKSEEKLEELVDYIAFLKEFYMSVLSEEKADYYRAFIKGKLKALDDIEMKLEKSDKIKK
ncbi:hypothetical protein [Neobacillus cucumis]|uniref:hypothetical protein n=1 Tax=Neobacillus cucumis TaxID=1740721 RepID=UPI00285346B7|nr:hypothetical protein [Neobacillus cucumis]MDR4949798.1 hypothetical protein [Neobacillus cucumis]